LIRIPFNRASNQLRAINFLVDTLGFLPRQVNFRKVRPRVCRTDFTHIAIAELSVRLRSRPLTFLIQRQNLSPWDSRIAILSC
jgi:hypothetical protein